MLSPRLSLCSYGMSKSSNKCKACNDQQWLNILLYVLSCLPALILIGLAILDEVSCRVHA